MADIYVRSTDGNNADSGATWALAKADLTGAAAIDAAGDVIYISQVHAESTAAALTFTLAGTAAAPTKIICANDAAEPPTAVATTGTITTTGTNGMTFAVACAYIYGLTFNCGTGAGTASITLNNSNRGFVEYESCLFNLVNTSASSRINLFNNAGRTRLKSCTVKFGASGQCISTGASMLFFWDGGGIAAGGTSPTTLFVSTSSVIGVLSGLDLSEGSSTMNIFSAAELSYVVMRNCKLPASWTGSFVTGTVPLHARYEMHNCDSGDTNYRVWVVDFAGTVVQETVVVRTGGASDGTTTISWKMVTNANAEYPHLALASTEIVRWNETTGSAITATVEILTDNVTLTDGECWVEVQYLSTSGFPLGSFVSDAKASVLATAANQATSTETWTTTGLTTPVKQKLSVTFTPQEKGFIHAVVKLAKASTTVYVDPELTVS